MSPYMPEKCFSFISNASSLKEDTFGVVQFTGTEGLSVPYAFEIMLVSNNTAIDLDEVISLPAKFTIHRKEGNDVDFHGILNSFEQLHKYNEYVFYRAHLVPRLWWLSITHHNQVCLQKSVPEIVELALKDSGLSTLDYEFKLKEQYNAHEYVCQYNESHFNFISRWLEREGLYYYFDQSGSTEKIIITDSYIAHTCLPDVWYVPPSGLLNDHETEIVNSFTCRQRQLPQKIFLKDYNYERPSLGISGSADVDDRGRGIDYIYGEYFPDSKEGDRLASIRAEILNCRKREFFGESTVPFLEPGYIFTLKGHYRDDFNQQYLVESITHEGNQVGYLLPEISEGLPGYKNTIFYRNSFSAIPAQIQFRSERKAAKPHISGTLHAIIDAEGSGKYAELDEHGRYKVRLPFDESDGHKSGKASTYLRMMQPYANQKGGMQFPLTKGTEVLLTFIDGDPDRPVIAGAVSNPETPSPVTSKNQTESVIQTGGNNKIRMEDKKGKERIIMESPTAGSWVRIGAPNDPPDPYVVENDDNVNNTFTDSSGEWVFQRRNGNNATYRLTKIFPNDMTKDMQLLAGFEYTIDGYTWIYSGLAKNDEGKTFYREKTVVIKIVDPKTYGDENKKDGIRLHTNDNLWIESNDKYGDYHVGLRSDGPRKINTDTVPKTGDLLAKFGSDYNPTGMLARHEKNSQSFDEVLSNAHVRVSSLDTINTQEGNIYDFGGYWNYNLGNCYVENHINQSAELNRRDSHDLLEYEKPEDKQKGGPDWHQIKSNEISDKGIWTNGNVWVNKKYGNSYDYVKGSSIEVKEGSSQSIQYGGRHVETKYTGGGVKVFHSWSENCQSSEESYDPTTGSLLSYEFKDHKHFTYEASIPTYPKLKISTCASALLDTSISISANQKLELDFAANLNFILSGGIGHIFECKMNPIKLTYNTAAKKLEYHGPFSEVDKRADIRAKNEKLLLSKLTTKIVSQDCQFDMAEAVVYKHSMDAMIGTFFHL